MAAVSAYSAAEPFVTKDGSLVRELMHPARHESRAQSLAEAVVPVGGETTLHRHRTSEELYHFTSGSGIMTLAAETFAVQRGDTGVHPARHPAPGPKYGYRAARHSVCVCAPYSHDDTELLD